MFRFCTAISTGACSVCGLPTSPFLPWSQSNLRRPLCIAIVWGICAGSCLLIPRFGLNGTLVNESLNSSGKFTCLRKFLLNSPPRKCPLIYSRSKWLRLTNHPACISLTTRKTHIGPGGWSGSDGPGGIVVIDSGSTGWPRWRCLSRHPRWRCSGRPFRYAMRANGISAWTRSARAGVFQVLDADYLITRPVAQAIARVSLIAILHSWLGLPNSAPLPAVGRPFWHGSSPPNRLCFGQRSRPVRG